MDIISRYTAFSITYKTTISGHILEFAHMATSADHTDYSVSLFQKNYLALFGEILPRDDSNRQERVFMSLKASNWADGNHAIRSRKQSFTSLAIQKGGTGWSAATYLCAAGRRG